MSITITSFPNADLDGDISNKSYWSAVHQPVVVNLLRKDKVLVSVATYFGGDKTILTAGAGGMDEAVVGEYIYFESGDGSQLGTFSIFAVDIPSNSILIVNTMTGSIAGGFINFVSARLNHSIETAIMAIEPPFNPSGYAERQIGSIKSVCSPSGRATVNVMEYLKILVDYYEAFAFDERHWRDQTLGGLSSIRYRETYNTETLAWQNVLYLGALSYVNSAQQIQDRYGYNMASYVTSLAFTGAKFMCDFVKPTLFNSFPFALTTILSEHLYPTPDSEDPTITGLIVDEIFKDINHTTLSGVNTNIFDATDVAGVYRIMLSSDTSIPANTSTIIVSLIANPDSSDILITENKIVKYNSKCAFKNPVYLNWLGTNGGRNFWLFDEVQNDLLEVKDLGEFTKQINDLETDIGNGEYIGKNATPELICKAYLELEDIRGLKGLMMSPDVLMLTNTDTWQTDNETTSPPSALPKWKRVKVLPQTFKVLSTNQSHAEIELTLLLPTINIQTQ